MADDTNAEGIPLRDYFAGQYMAAAMVKSGECKEYELKDLFGDVGNLRRETIAAALAYRYADAMIARRKHVASKGA